MTERSGAPAAAARPRTTTTAGPAAGRPPRPTAGVVHLLALVLVSLNLRGAIAAVSPVLDDIRADLGLGAGTAALLTTLPVLCFALGSLLVPGIARRWGVDRAVITALLVIAAGIALRPWGGAVPLLVGTVVIGAGITIGNVLIPVLVKRDFSRRLNTVTAVSTASLTTGAAITAVLMTPLAHVLGWRAATAVWAVMAAGGAALWWRSSQGRGEVELPRTRGRSPVWRAGGAWALAVYFGTQSGSYYAVTAWLPGMLRDMSGLSADAAALAMSTFQVLGIVGALATPVLVARTRSPRVPAVMFGLLWAATFVGLLLAPGLWAVWILLGGAVQGGGISVAFILIARRAVDADVARSLSAMVQAVGYSLGAGLPVLVGVLSGAGWTIPLGVMALVALVMAGSGFAAGSSGTIGHAAPRAAEVPVAV
ncbi:MFS transporter [Cellulomonas sp. P22]|uniref:MFS transporter n=1 Tax=Cellulomonas sp. P22 TaxID=3373189 RepID=UPI00379018E2